MIGNSLKQPFRFGQSWWIAEWLLCSSTRFKRPSVQTFTSGRPKGQGCAQFVVEAPAAGFDRTVHSFARTIDEGPAEWHQPLFCPNRLIVMRVSSSVRMNMVLSNQRTGATQSRVGLAASSTYTIPTPLSVLRTCLVFSKSVAVCLLNSRRTG